MVDEVTEGLREMAQHRGLKLVKSRRRKPGTGDFGKFGLTDQSGAPLVGIGKEGLLTASPEEIENYLRAGTLTTWQQSARLAPDRPKPRASTTGAAAANRSSNRRREGASDVQEPIHRREASAARGATPSAESHASRVRRSGTSPPQPQRRAKPKPEIVRQDPVLALRAGKPTDAAAIVRLLTQLRVGGGDTSGFASRLSAIKKAGGGLHLAELGQLVGCVAWTTVATVQHGPVGRLSLLLVDEAHRRRGIGAQLLAIAEAALAKRGCATLEAMSDIDLRNSHNFFRSSGFTQKSYRFARAIKTPEQ